MRRGSTVLHVDDVLHTDLEFGPEFGDLSSFDFVRESHGSKSRPQLITQCTLTSHTIAGCHLLLILREGGGRERKEKEREGGRKKLVRGEGWREMGIGKEKGKEGGRGGGGAVYNIPTAAVHSRGWNADSVKL